MRINKEENTNKHSLKKCFKILKKLHFYEMLTKIFLLKIIKGGNIFTEKSIYIRLKVCYQIQNLYYLTVLIYFLRVPNLMSTLFLNFHFGI